MRGKKEKHLYGCLKKLKSELTTTIHSPPCLGYSVFDKAFLLDIMRNCGLTFSDDYLLNDATNEITNGISLYFTDYYKYLHENAKKFKKGCDYINELLIKVVDTAMYKLSIPDFFLEEIEDFEDENLYYEKRNWQIRYLHKFCNLSTKELSKRYDLTVSRINMILVD